MKRREFILAFGGAAASILRTQPLSAQQTRPVIGILGRTTAEEYTFLIAAFPQRPDRSWLRRGPKPHNRISLGR